MAKLDIWNTALSRIGHKPITSPEDPSPAGRSCRLHWDRLLKSALSAHWWPFAMTQAPLSSIDSQSHTTAGTGGSAFQVPFAFRFTTQLTVIKRTVADGTEVTLVAGTDYGLTLAGEGSPAVITTTVPVTSSYEIRVVVTTARTGWEHVYALPADFVRGRALLLENTRYSMYGADCRISWSTQANDGNDGQILLCDLDPQDIEAIEYTCLFQHVEAWPPLFAEALAWRLAAELALDLQQSETKHERCMGWADKKLDEAICAELNAQKDTVQPMTPSLAARE